MKRLNVAASTLIVSSILFAACQSPASEDLSAEIFTPASQTTYQYVMGTPAHLQDIMAWGHLSGEAQAQARATSKHIARASLVAAAPVFELFSPENPVSLAERLQTAEQVVAENQQAEYAFMMEQSIAYLFLNEYLADTRLAEIPPSVLAKQTLDQEHLTAVSFATRLLTQNQNPNADLIAATLTVLQDHWTESEVRRQAKAAEEAALAYLSDQENCDTCDAAKQGTTARVQGIRDGLDNLRSLLAQ